MNRNTVFFLSLLLVVSAGTVQGAELLSNGDFESRTAEDDYDDWVETGDTLNWSAETMEATSCSGGHGTYSPALHTQLINPGPAGILSTTFTQVVNTTEFEDYFAGACFAGSAFCGQPLGVDDPTQNSAELSLVFFDGPDGTGSVIGTDTTGNVIASASNDVEVALNLSGTPPTGTQSVAFNVQILTGDGLGWGECFRTDPPASNQYICAVHSASYDATEAAATATPTVPAETATPEPVLPATVGRWNVYH